MNSRMVDAAGEDEQLRRSLDDARAEAAWLAAERDALRAELGRRTARLREAEARLEERSCTADVDRARASATEEELHVALEELRLLAAELDGANQALSRVNGELERRVAERTAELAGVNARLRDSEERLRIAQRYAGAGSWDWDIRADQVAWSEEYFDLYGLDPAEVTPGREAWLASVHPEDREAAAAALEACLRRRDPDFRVEYRILHPRRGLRWLSGRGRLVCDAAGDPVRLIGLNIDVTDRKRAELAAEEANELLKREVEEEVKAREAAQAKLFQTLKLEALGQLTGGVAHDFNNLLSVIMSGAALLRRDEGQDPARRERLLDAIEQAARRGADLTRRLLTFARRQALRPQPLDLEAWLGEMRELLARSLRGDITIEIEVAPGLWPAMTDVAELELAVLNLAVNARDAMPKGGVLRLSAGNAELDPVTDPDGLGGEFVRLVLQDTGTGMPPEVMARVFEPFFSTKEAGRGTGLGLAQVYGFARQSGGGARISSVVGQGTAVTLLLPRSAAALAEAARPEPQRSATPEPAGPALRVLLVEDDDDVAALTAEMLRHLGHEVARVTSGPAAVGALASGLEADLVMTDVVMPGGEDGVDLARRLSATRPELPLLICSGYGGAPSRVAAAGLPLLRKPFSLVELGRALAAARRRARCVDAARAARSAR
jgi:PAS domain S-box-containing protein